MAKIWVKAAHPRAHFYQDVLEPGEEGRPARMVSERVHAPTFLQDGHPDHQAMIPVPMRVTDTLAVRNALRETFPLLATGTDQPPVPSSLVQCLDDEVAAYLKNPWHVQQHERDQLVAEKAAVEERLVEAARKQAEERSFADLSAENERLRARLAELETSEPPGDDSSADGDGGDGGQTAARPQAARSSAKRGTSP